MSNEYSIYPDKYFLFNDGEFTFWTVLEFRPDDPKARGVRRLGTVRVRRGRPPVEAVRAKFGTRQMSHVQLVVSWKSSVNKWRRKYPHKTLYKAPYDLNRVMCRTCGEAIESMHTHDYVTCSCGRISVDGGYDYFKRSVMGPFEEMP